MFFTGERSVLKPGFEDAALWPEVRADTFNMAQPETFVLRPLSMRYVYLNNDKWQVKATVTTGNTDTDRFAVNLIRITDFSLVEDTLIRQSIAGEKLDIQFESEYTVFRNYLCFLNSGDTAISCTLSAEVIDIEYTGVLEIPRLFHAYPNPFLSSTKVSYTLPQPDFVRLKVYDISGRQVALLVHGKQGRGYHTVHWNSGSLSAGIYIIELKGRKCSYSVKCMLNK
jgi:hypothetical protein